MPETTRPILYLSRLLPHHFVVLVSSWILVSIWFYLWRIMFEIRGEKGTGLVKATNLFINRWLQLLNSPWPLFVRLNWLVSNFLHIGDDMEKLSVELSVMIEDKEYSLAFDLSEKGLKGKPLTPERFEWCIKCLIPSLLRNLRDHGKIIET